MAGPGADRDPRVIRATAAEAGAAGRLLDRFNRDYDEPTPGPDVLARRIAGLIEAGETEVLLAGEGGAEGILVLRFRPAIWAAAEEAYLAELYVLPGSRRRGLGAALMEAALKLCRERGCAWVDLGTEEGDRDAHRLYERFGFSRRSGDEQMFVYELEL